jgi:hypothetical protein
MYKKALALIMTIVRMMIVLFHALIYKSSEILTYLILDLSTRRVQHPVFR